MVSTGLVDTGDVPVHIPVEELQKQTEVFWVALSRVSYSANPEVSGSWTIRVNNPDGGQSNTFGFTVNAANPVINSISPSSPTHRGSNQTVTVFGSNFQAGLTVDRGLPWR